MEILSFFTSNFIGIIAVIVVLGALIFFHELGHFAAARALGIGVVTFSLGFGPKIFSFKKNKTTYCLSALPLGGYVATVGEYDKDVADLGFSENEVVSNRPPLHRIILAVAGPLANLLLALVIYWGIAYNLGEIVILPEITEVVENSPAMQAGLQANDKIIAINGQNIENWDQVVQIINSSQGQELALDIQRADSLLSLNVTAQATIRKNVFGEDEEAWILGIQAGGSYENKELGLFDSLIVGAKECYSMISLTGQSLVKLVSGSVPSDSVGGPILIAQMVGEQAKIGIVPVLLLAALISINLGLLNLLPVPVLDGGLILFCLIEMIIRRPISERVQNISMQLGVFLLISLMVFATYNDIARLISG